MRSNQYHENLHILVIKRIVDQQINTFPKFMDRLKEEIDKGIAQLNVDYLQQTSEIKNKLLIVSHEYLYGYDHEWDYYGLTRDEKTEFKTKLKDMVLEISQKYNIDVMIAPGTVVWKKEEKEAGNKVHTRNTAYFFSKDGIGKHHKEKEGRITRGDTIKWQSENPENILTTICCENRNFYPIHNEHSIQFIPSAGMNLFPTSGDGAPGTASNGYISPTPGITFISVDAGYPTYIRQTTIASAAASDKEGCLSVQKVDALLKKPLVVAVNKNTSIYSFPFDQKFYDDIVKYQTEVVIRQLSLFFSGNQTKMEPIKEEAVLLLRVLKGEIPFDALEPYINKFLDSQNPIIHILATYGPHLPLTKLIEKARNNVDTNIPLSPGRK